MSIYLPVWKYGFARKIGITITAVEIPRTVVNPPFRNWVFYTDRKNNLRTEKWDGQNKRRNDGRTQRWDELTWTHSLHTGFITNMHFSPFDKTRYCANIQGVKITVCFVIYGLTIRTYGRTDDINKFPKVIKLQVFV